MLDFEKALEKSLNIKQEEKRQEQDLKNNTDVEFETFPIRRGITEIQSLLEIISSHGFVCGGYARYALSDSRDVVPAGDVDIYAKTDADFEILKTKFAVIIGADPESFETVGFAVSIPNWKDYYGPKIQLIRPIETPSFKIKGEPKEVLSNFDFTIARAAIITPKFGIADKVFQEDELAKRLRIKKVHHPLSTMLRIAKYRKKGYNISMLEMLRLFQDWDKRDQEFKDKSQELANKLFDLEYQLRHNKDDEFKLEDIRTKQVAIYELISTGLTLTKE